MGSMIDTITLPAAVEKYVGSGLHSVDGWFSETDARLVALIGAQQRVSSIRGDLCEIGVYRGRCLVLLGLLAQCSETVLGVDIFGRQSEDIDGADVSDEQITRANLTRFCNGLRYHLVSKHSLHLKPEDLRVDGGPPAGFRLFCVDGGHTREIAAHDFCLGEELLTEGGVVVVDDFFNRNWPGVSEGINRIYHAGETSLRPFAIGQAKVFFAKGDFADLYRASIRNAWHRMGHEFVNEAEMFGAPVAIVKPPSGKLALARRYIKNLPIIGAIRRAQFRCFLHGSSMIPIALSPLA